MCCRKEGRWYKGMESNRNKNRTKIKDGVGKREIVS